MHRIFKAKTEDISAILHLLEEGRQIMRACGNVTQWTGGYPTKEMIQQDIQVGGGYLIKDGEGTPLAYFAFLEGPDPTYSYIYEGQWLDLDTPYHVLHRLAKDRGAKGVFSVVMDFMKAHSRCLRVDTHEKNLIMRHLLEENGFVYCGKIICSDDTERLAYQLVF